MPTAAQIRFSGTTRVMPVYKTDLAQEQSVSLVASGTYVKGLVLGELSGTPGTFKAYASGNNDGSEIPKCILQYACTTDASGNITMLGEFSQTQKSAPAWVSGFFKTQDLTGMDANAVTKMAAEIISGNLTTGVVRI